MAFVISDGSTIFSYFSLTMPEIGLQFPVASKEQYNNATDDLKMKLCSLWEAEFNWLHLPYEIWLLLLVDYGIEARDLVNLEYTCRWFGNYWGGGSVTEEAARLIIKKHKRMRFGELVNRVSGASWKEKLCILEGIEARTATLAAGSYQNIFTTNGYLLTWGAGRFGQLGNDSHEDRVQFQNVTPLIPPEAGKVIQVSAGCGHSGFVTERGYAFTCGDNRYSQLGHSDFNGQTCAVPTRIYKGLSGTRCLQIACGSSHTLFLTDMGQVYVTGQGDSGQLGLGPRVAAALVPTSVLFPCDDYNIVYITAGIAHNILLSECGKAFTFGLASVGQLGHGGTKNLHQPTLVSVLRERKIIYAAAGVCHSIFVDSHGSVYTCGKGKGLLGHGDTRIRTVPAKVEGLEGIPIVRAAAGVGRSIFITSSGMGYWCGEGMGELKNHTAMLPTAMKLPEPLHSASIGNSHVVLQMNSGRLMSMGNNGRFQTGHNTKDSAAVNSYTYLELPIAQ